MLEGDYVAISSAGAGDRAAGVNVHRALDQKSGVRAVDTEGIALSSGYRSATENNEVTAPQIAAQSPSDNSNVTIKDAPV